MSGTVKLVQVTANMHTWGCDVRPLKALLASLVVLGTLLVGFTTLAPKASALARYGTCAENPSYSLDGGWHLSQRAGYVYHLVEDDFTAYNVGGYCTYTSHVNVDLCNNLGCSLGVFEAWIPWYGEIGQVEDYHFSVGPTYPLYSANNHEGVRLYFRNSSTQGWCRQINLTCDPSSIGGAEYERSYGIVSVQYNVPNANGTNKMIINI